MVPCNEITRYEVVLTDGKTSHFLEFSARVGRRALFRTLCAFGPRIVELSGMSATDVFHWNPRAQAWIIANGFAVKRSGRTERDVKNAGEVAS